MNNNRKQLHDLFRKYVKNVYYKDPPTRLEYPCIFYKPGGFRRVFADNSTYRLYRTYTVQLITKDVDPDVLKDLIIGIPKLKSGPEFVTDNLNHYQFSIEVIY